MPKCRAAVLLAALLSIAVAAPPSAAQDRTIRIRMFDAGYLVHANGDVDVSERLTFVFSGQWNGVVRDISLQHNTGRGRAQKLRVGDFSVTGGGGQQLRVDDEGGSKTRRLRIWIPGAVNAERQIVIRYRVSNAIRFFYAGSAAGELDELYWNVTGNAWDMPIERARAVVTLPPGLVPTRTAVYTGAVRSTSSDAAVDKAGNVVTFTLRGELPPFEGMTVGVGWPPGTIRSRPSETQSRISEALRYWPLLAPFLIFAFAYRAWNERGRDPKENSIAVQYEPLEMMSPAELGTLVDHEAEMRDITATLVDLAVRGYVRIEEKTEKRLLGLVSDTEFVFHLVRPREQWSGLATHEERYLKALFVDTMPEPVESIALSDLRDKFYKSVPKLRDAIYESLVRSGYYRKRPDRVKGTWYGMAVVVLIPGVFLAGLSAGQAWDAVSPAALGIAGVVGSIIVVAFGSVMPARTVGGARAREAALGFKEFLSRVESERYRKMITSPEMFERYLPYAMAFGVEDKWAKAFEGIYRDPPGWYTGGTGQFRATDFSSRMGSMSEAAGSAMSSSPSSSGSSGGGSSGGGSGGGGGSGF